jgi:GTP cyclohydrolase II
LKRKIDQESDTSFHQLRSDELEEMAKEFLENGGFRVYSEPFNASEGKKQPDALAVSDDRLIVVEYTTTGDLLHERKMESFLNMKDILADISGGKKVEFWLLTNRMSEPKVSNLEAKGIKVLMTMPRGKWPDSSFDLE